LITAAVGTRPSTPCSQRALNDSTVAKHSEAAIEKLAPRRSPQRAATFSVPPTTSERER